MIQLRLNQVAHNYNIISAHEITWFLYPTGRDAKPSQRLLASFNLSPRNLSKTLKIWNYAWIKPFHLEREKKEFYSPIHATFEVPKIDLILSNTYLYDHLFSLVRNVMKQSLLMWNFIHLQNSKFSVLKQLKRFCYFIYWFSKMQPNFYCVNWATTLSWESNWNYCQIDWKDSDCFDSFHCL